MRQAIITVYPALAPGAFDPNGESIMFHQPWSDVGISMDFNFSKSYFQFQTDCNIRLYNVNSTIVNLFAFNPEDYRLRPRIEIRAGESSLQIYNSSDIPLLKATLPLIYTGMVYYFSDDRYATEQILTLNLTDLDLATRTGRAAGATFQAGEPLLQVVENLSRQLPGMDIDTSALTTSVLGNAVLQRRMEFSGRFILSDIFLKLGRYYGFSFYVDAGGTLVFIPNSEPLRGAPTIVTSANGLVAYPNGINFNQYSVVTFFGRPEVFFPGDWMQIQSPSFSTGSTYALVVEANYSFNDSEASIEYIVSPSGEPIEKTPVLKI